MKSTKHAFCTLLRQGLNKSNHLTRENSLQAHTIIKIRQVFPENDENILCLVNIVWAVHGVVQKNNTNDETAIMHHTL